MKFASSVSTRFATAITFALLAAACSSSSKAVDPTVAPPATVESQPTTPAVTEPADSAPPPSSADTVPPASEVSETVVTEPPPIQGGDIVVGLASEPPTLDPANTSGTLELGSLWGAMFDTLMVNPNPTGDEPPEPMLLESLSESADRLTWTMKIRPDVSFHDGTPLNADAVKFNLERQRTSIYNSSSLALITAINVVDPMTLDVVLAQPWTGFPTAMTTIVGVIIAPSSADPNRSPVGTGPYTFTEWAIGDSISVTRNESFWGEPVNVDSIRFRFVPDETARYTAFQSGDLDSMVTITETRVIQAEEDGYAVIAPPITGYGLILINTTREPLNDVRVRQALEIGYDRDAIADAFDGDDYNEAGFGAYPPGHRWYEAPSVAPTFDPDAATALLADYAKPVKFTFKLLAGDANVTDSVSAMIEYWNELGMDVSLELVPDVTAYVTSVALAKDFDMVGWVGGTSREPDAVYFNQFHTGGSTNYMGYSNPELDALLDAGRIETDEAKRKAIYGEVQQILRNDIPTLYTNFGKIRFLMNDNVTAEPAVFFPARTVRLTK